MASHELILGIDLGTSFSTAAAWVNGKMYLVPDERGEPCIPTVVHFGDKGPPLVGYNALEARRTDPENTVAGIKRLLGRDLDSPEGRVFSASSPNRLKPAANGRAIIHTRRGEHTSEEVASIAYAHLKRLAELRFQRKVNRAVVTVPAASSPASIGATVTAARMAGLDVVDTVHEPTAAAIAFGLDRFRGQRRLLVYDFGGGTFDVTVMQQQDQTMEPLTVGGDASLGGDDFDLELAQYAAGLIWKRHQVELHHDVVRWDRVIRSAEATKRALSAMQAARLRVQNAYSHGGRHHDIDLTIGRDDITTRWQGLVDRSLKTTAETMLKAGLRPSGIDTLLLIGGTTYIPMVRDSVTRMMSTPGEHPGDPQTAVACGAAVTAARHALQAA